MNYLQSNIILLKDKKNVTNAAIALQVGKSNNTISNWINGIAEPGIKEIQIIAQFLDVSLDSLINVDLSNVNLNEIEGEKKKVNNVNPNVNNSVNLNAKKPPKGACTECVVKDNLIAATEGFLQRDKVIIDLQKEKIKYLQNQLDKMEIEMQERERNKQPEQKERKTA